MQLAAARAAGVNTTLIELQNALLRCPIEDDKIALLERARVVLESPASASSLDKTRGAHEKSVRTTCARSIRLLKRAGLSDLVSKDTTGLHFFLNNFPTGTTVVRRYAGEMVSAAHGMFLGTMFFRPLPSTLFPALRRATVENFCLEPRPPAAPADALYGSLDTLRSYAEAHAALRAAAANASTPVGKAFAACGLPPFHLAVNFDRDGSLVGGTDQSSMIAVYLHIANFEKEWAGLSGTSALWALYTPFQDPGNISAEKAAYCRRRLNQEVLDVYHEHINKLEAGLLFELAPRDVLLLVPKAFLRRADHPQRQSDVACKAAASALAPCMYCQATRACICCALPAAAKDRGDLALLASVAPFVGRAAVAPAVAAARAALLLKAKVQGVTPMGRVPAPLTAAGRRASLLPSSWPIAMGGGPDRLHTVRGLMRGLFRVLLSHARIDSAVLGARTGALLDFVGPWSRLLRPEARLVLDAAAYRKGKTGAKMATKRFASALLLLPVLVEGCPDAIWDTVTQAALLLIRVDEVTKQRELSLADVGVLNLLCRATLCALREFPEMRRTIKAHLLLHLAAFVPHCGPGGATDVTLMESLHRLLHRLRAHVKATVGVLLDDSRLAAMLQRAKLVAGTAVAADAAAALKRALGAGAGVGAGVGAGATGGNLAGLLSGANFTPPFKAPSLPAADAAVPGLGGFLSPAPQRKLPAGGLPIPGGPYAPERGALCNFKPPYPPFLAPLASVVLVDHLAVSHPAGLSAAHRAAWKSRLDGATTFNGGFLPLADFTKGVHYKAFECALTAEGAAKLCNAVGVRRFTTLHFRKGAGGRSSSEGTPALRVAKRPFVSYGVDAAFEFAANGEAWAMGRLEALLTIPDKRHLLKGQAGPARAPAFYAVLRMCAPRPEELVELCGRVPALEGYLEPWEWAARRGAPVYEVVSAQFLIRREHVQPRSGPDLGGELQGAWWRFPRGGPEGLVPMPTLPAGAEEEDEDEEDWRQEEGFDSDYASSSAFSSTDGESDDGGADSDSDGGGGEGGGGDKRRKRGRASDSEE